MKSATVGKLVWWIYSKPESLWVKWVHQIYIKTDSWPSHLPKSHMSGNWKAICKVKDALQEGYDQVNWLADHKGYSVTSGYEWLRHKEQKVGWAKLVWNKWALPKHKFMSWLILRQAINVKVKLFRHGISKDDVCCICGADTETVEYLFQNCTYVQRVMSEVCAWLSITTPQGNGIIWIGRRNWTPIKKQICLAAIMAIYYLVWQQRNTARLEGIILRPQGVSAQIQNLIRSKVIVLKDSALSIRDRMWIRTMS